MFSVHNEPNPIEEKKASGWFSSPGANPTPANIFFLLSKWWGASYFYSSVIVFTSKRLFPWPCWWLGCAMVVAFQFSPGILSKARETAVILSALIGWVFRTHFCFWLLRWSHFKNPEFRNPWWGLYLWLAFPQLLLGWLKGQMLVCRVKYLGMACKTITKMFIVLTTPAPLPPFGNLFRNSLANLPTGIGLFGFCSWPAIF